MHFEQHTVTFAKSAKCFLPNISNFRKTSMVFVSGIFYTVLNDWSDKETSNGLYLIGYGDDTLIQRHSREEEVLGIIDIKWCH